MHFFKISRSKRKRKAEELDIWVKGDKGEMTVKYKF